jgi:DNA end-binding protein Ku
MDWDPAEFRDTYQERVAQLVEAKKKGESVEKAESPAAPTNVVNLMDALQASVDRAKGTQRGGSTRRAGARKAATQRSRQRRKETTKSGHSRQRLQDLTKGQLYRRASEAGVPGRAAMNREELIKALSSEDGTRRAAS